MVFDRNERYRTPAKLKRWTKVMVAEHAVASVAFANEELDVVNAAKGESATATIASGLSVYLGFNLARPPFDDRAVRLAFARSLDREALVRDVIPFPAVAASFIAPGLPASDPTDRAQEFDPAAARALLAG